MGPNPLHCPFVSFFHSAMARRKLPFFYSKFSMTPSRSHETYRGQYAIMDFLKKRNFFLNSFNNLDISVLFVQSREYLQDTFILSKCTLEYYIIFCKDESQSTLIYRLLYIVKWDYAKSEVIIHWMATLESSIVLIVAIHIHGSKKNMMIWLI